MTCLLSRPLGGEWSKPVQNKRPDRSACVLAGVSLHLLVSFRCRDWRMFSLDLMTAPTPLQMAILSPQPTVMSRPLESGEAGKRVHSPVGSDHAAFLPSRACASAETGKPLPCRRRGRGPAGLQMPYRYRCHHIIQRESYSNVSEVT